MEAYDILLIDLPMSYFGTKDKDVSSLQEIQETPYIAFNPGLLSIGSYLIDHGFSVKLKHIKSDKNIDEDLGKIVLWGIPKIIGISCSYFQTYDASLKICQMLNKHFPDAIIVIGGQHAGNIPAYVLEDCPCIDFVLMGEGEATLEDLLLYLNGIKVSLSQIGGIAFGQHWIERGYSFDLTEFDHCTLIDFIDDKSNYVREVEGIYQSKVPARIIPLDEMPYLHYDLYEDYLTYPCYVEESRGCYGVCQYCVAPIYGNFRFKSAERFLGELDRAVEIFGLENNYPFLASNFGVNVENTLRIFKGLVEKYQGRLHWNAEFRVDLNWEKYIDEMYRAGCRGFNIGIDSPCKTTLELMQKTNSVEFYLNKAKALIEAISKYSDAAICVNLMFYPGENAETIMEVIRFISKYYDQISAVHYSPTNLYYGTSMWKNFNSLNQKYGTTIVKTPYFDRVHVYPLNPSILFDNHEANYWCRIIEKLFSGKALFSDYHETRLTRDKEGHLSEETRKKGSQIYSDNKVE